MANSPFDDGRAPPPPAPQPPTLPPKSTPSPANDALIRIAARTADPAKSPGAHGQSSRARRPPGLSEPRSLKRSETPLLKEIWKPYQPPKVPLREPSLLKCFLRRFAFPTGSRKPPADKYTPSPAVIRNVTHTTGTPISSLDTSPARTHAVLAGRDILRIIQLTDYTTFTSCTETQNLRAAITAYAATSETTKGQVSARQREQLAASDVKWSHGSFDKKIATAAANGQIAVYDIERTGLEWLRLHEHNRQVHRLGFNPFGGYLMLSGSQDATIRMWDLRDCAGDRSVLTIFSRKRFPGNSDAVRDLRWSPTNAMEFAAATDGGVVQRWDIRKENAPLLKISAHEKACQTVDWHPDGKHIVSAGADKNVKVWDFSSSDRRIKPSWQLRAPQVVMHARWRPAYRYVGANRPGRWLSTQLATSFDKEDPRTLIWDFRRPSVPSRIHDRYDDPPSDLLWHSNNLLWSVGSHGIFTQTDIMSMPKRSHKRSATVIGWNSDDTLFVASQQGELPRSTPHHVNHGLLQQQPRGASTVSSRSSIDALSLEDPALVRSSLSNRYGQPKTSAEASASMDSTQATEGSGEPDLPAEPLEESLQMNYIFRPNQWTGIIKAPGVSKTDTFISLAANYQAPFPLPGHKNYVSHFGNNVHLMFSETFLLNAKAAEDIGQYRVSGHWKIFASLAESELKTRAERNREQRLLATKTEAAKDGATCNDKDSHLLSPRSSTGKTLPDTGLQHAPDTSANEAAPFPQHESCTPKQVQFSHRQSDSGESQLDLDYELKSPEEKHLDKRFDDMLTKLKGVNVGTGEYSDALSECKDLLPATSSKLSFPPSNNPAAAVCYEDIETFGEEFPAQTVPNVETHDYILSDFARPTPSDSDSPPPRATMTGVLDDLIKFYVEQLNDLQFPTYCWIHICPYFNTFDPMYSNHAVRLNLINVYHNQLMVCELYKEAAALRIYAQKDYPEFVGRVSYDVDSGGTWCANCDKSKEGTEPGSCERCKKACDPCAICHGAGLSAAVSNPEPSDSLWFWCQKCGHGGHQGCMTDFWKNKVASEGACPVSGCSCDCVPATRRDEINKQLEEEEKVKRNPVRPDNWVSEESAAVSRARGLTGGQMVLQGDSKEGNGAGRPQALGGVGRSVSISDRVQIFELVNDDNGNDEQEEEEGEKPTVEQEEQEGEKSKGKEKET